MNKLFWIFVLLMLAVSASLHAEDTFVPSRAGQNSAAKNPVTEAPASMCETFCRQKNADAVKLCRTYEGGKMPECLREAIAKFDTCLQECQGPPRV